MNVLIAALLASCGGEPAPAPEAAHPADSKCPNVDMDRLAADWIKVEGQRGDHKYRFRIVETGGGYEMYYIAGDFQKRRMAAERRTSDVEFTEIAVGPRREAFDRGEQSLVRLYVEPRKETCSLRVSEMAVSMRDGKEVEMPKPGFQEYLAFPEGQPFTFLPCDESLFFGKAATSKAVADQQVAAQGSGDPLAEMGDQVAVAAWSDVSKDGPEDCTYDMDLYFDDRPVEGKQNLPAGAVGDGVRHWYVPDWYAPYTGNHGFEIYRYRTCAGGERERIAVACIEAVLQ